MRQRIKAWMPWASRRFRTVILLQMAILAAMLCYDVLRPAQTLSIGCEDFLAAGIGDGIYTGSSIILKDKPKQSLLGWGYSLGAGAYDVEARYRTQRDANSEEQVPVGAVKIDVPWPSKYTDIQLKDEDTIAHGTLKIPGGGKAENLSIGFYYRGNGLLEVEGINITEATGYRYLKILFVALLFIMADMFYFFFFAPDTKMTQGKLVFLALAGIVFWSSLPFMTDFVFAGHDTEYHLRRIVTVAAELKNDQLPIRIYTEANNYYGYAAPIFYGDVFLYLPAVLYNCKIPLYMCYQIYAIMMNALTCAIAYYSFLRMTRDRSLSVFGTALYTLCAFRLTHMTVRGAVGEYSAMAFLPLILLGIYEIYCKEKPEKGDWLPLSLGMSGSFFCHTHTTELVFVDLVLFCALLFGKTIKISRIVAILKAAGVCILLCAWMLIPFLDYYFTQSIILNDAWFSLQDKGTYLIQLFGLFMNGWGDTNFGNMRGSMPLTIGFSLTLGILLILFCLTQRKKWGLLETKAYPVWSMFFLIALINMIFSLAYFPWSRIQHSLDEMGQIIGFIQFPWRWLTPASALLVVSLIMVLAFVRKKNRWIYRGFCVSAMSALIVSSMFMFYQYTNIAGALKVDEIEATAYTFDRWFFPAGTREGIPARLDAEVTSGDVVIQSYGKDKGVGYIRLENKQDEISQVTIPIFAYQHYHATDEMGRDVPIREGDPQLTVLEQGEEESAEMLLALLAGLIEQRKKYA